VLVGARGRWLFILGGAAVALGAAGWRLGPVWAVAGVVAGPFAALLIASVWRVHATVGATDLLRLGRAHEALSRLEQEMPSWRTLARIWPGQFRDALAIRLLDRSIVLKECGQVAEAVAAAEEAVLIFRDRAAARPRRFTPGLADALYRLSFPLSAATRREEALTATEEAVQIYRGLATADPARYLSHLAASLNREAILLIWLERPGEALDAVTEAADIYQDAIPASQYDYSAAQALLIHGRLLCDQSRWREATHLLARGWQRAASRDHRDLLAHARPALKAAYHADPDAFISAWRAETGSEPPGWLTGPDSGTPGI
jgi:tetratricopeptide (TPR) repeat protein